MVEYYKTSKICPVCFSGGKVYRSRARNNFERIINSSKIFSMYRCHECGWRGIRLRKIKFKFNLISLINYILIVLVSYFVILFILKQVFKIAYFK